MMSYRTPGLLEAGVRSEINAINEKAFGEADARTKIGHIFNYKQNTKLL